ncbi:Cys-tRNA(Pro) deacylase [Clostridium sp. Cult1]|uniref:Cys-tRNA(Pro) deacylase n=1 Tax=Clostridium sp. Cult1 TaxID=2079002 RepID=UPI001F002F1C|nr:Cys-tRNA(Pro) deacylase [Clostridium sp. Cult1]MCF6463507.1 Cys-tRNA(Pro) deacylase [Clostridium sp. Cult1]
MSKIKTNAMRILDTHNIEYNIITYDKKDGKVDGVSVAKKIGKDPEKVFKTLVAQGSSGELYVFIIPVAKELDLKKAAKVSGEKKIEMLPVKDITKYTGYMRGGCSPIGMKKIYPTFIDESSLSLDSIIVSGGKIGVQIEMNIESLQSVTNAISGKLVKE